MPKKLTKKKSLSSPFPEAVATLLLLSNAHVSPSLSSPAGANLSFFSFLFKALFFSLLPQTAKRTSLPNVFKLAFYSQMGTSPSYTRRGVQLELLLGKGKNRDGTVAQGA